MNFNTSIMTVQLGGEVDLNVAGVSQLILNANNLHVIGYTSQGTDVSGVTGFPIINVGTNAPDYDNIINGEAINISTTGGCFQRLYNGTGVDLVPLGTPIKINVTTPGTGTSNIQKVNLLTYPIQI